MTRDPTRPSTISWEKRAAALRIIRIRELLDSLMEEEKMVLGSSTTLSDWCRLAKDVILLGMKLCDSNEIRLEPRKNSEIVRVDSDRNPFPNFRKIDIDFTVDEYSKEVRQNLPGMKESSPKRLSARELAAYNWAQQNALQPSTLSYRVKQHEGFYTDAEGLRDTLGTLYEYIDWIFEGSKINLPAKNLDLLSTASASREAVATAVKSARRSGYYLRNRGGKRKGKHSRKPRSKVRGKGNSPT